MSAGTDMDIQADAPAPLGSAVLLVAAMALGAAIGLLAPETGAHLSSGTDATLLVLIGLLFFEVRLADILQASGKWRFLALAWVANFAIIPLVGLAIAAVILPAEPLLFAGLMIYFLAPCTDWFLGFTRLARGDTALGAALIPMNLVTQLLLFPLWLWLLTPESGLMDPTNFPAILWQWFVVPFVAAQALRWLLERVLGAATMAMVLAVIGHLVPLVLAALILQIFAANFGTIATQVQVLAWCALAICLFFIATFVIGGALARLFRLSYKERALLAMTMAARNAPMMLALTAAAIPNQPLILAAIAFGMLIEIPQLTFLKELFLHQRRTRCPSAI